MITVQTYEITTGLFLGKSQYLLHGYVKNYWNLQIRQKEGYKINF